LKLASLERAHPWITDDKSQFGKPNTPYDFTKQNIKESQHRLLGLKNRKDKLSKQIDQRGMNLLAKKEEEVT
jgi:structural maintenance of chromosome 2